jgi:hypothetical protein
LVAWLLLLSANASLAEPTPDHDSPQPPSKVGGVSEHEVITIPLDQIWAYQMPGTHDIRELEPEVFGAVAKGISREEIVRREKASLFNRIGSRIPIAREGVIVQPCFAVLGDGLEALRNAQAELTSQQEPAQSFSSNSQLSIFFFSYSFGQYVHLDHVKRRGKTIQIAYRFVPHQTKQLTAHFALIPLGKLAPGEYRVDIVRLPLDQTYIERGFKSVDPRWNAQVVCRPFSFTVTE